MRALLLIVVVAGCEPGLPQRPLPELVRQAPLTAISVPALGFVEGEQLAWSVSAKGLTIGRAELVVGDHEIHSRFETGKLASMFARVRHELATVVDRDRPRAATELLEVDGQTTRNTLELHGPRFLAGDKVGTVPGGNLGHTLHSALGVIRAWASPEASAGFLFVIHDGDVYRLDVARPFAEDLRGARTLRVDCRIHGHEVTASISIWLRASADHTPVRLEIAADGVRLTAELLDTEA